MRIWQGDGMNYIAELNAFYDKLELKPLSSSGIALWHALMAVANKCGWKQEFTVATPVLMMKAGMSKKAVERARAELEAEGYITWKSRGGNQSAAYYLISRVGQNKSNTDVQTVAENVPQFDSQSVAINKHKQKHKNNNTMCNADADALFESLWKMYPNKRGKGQVSDANKRHLLDIGFEEMERAINRYKADLAEESWRKPQNGSTFFNGGYVDYLDDNYEPLAKKKQDKPAVVHKFNAFPQREYTQEDNTEIEKRMLQRR